MGGGLASGGGLPVSTGSLPDVGTTTGSVPAPVTAAPATNNGQGVALTRALARRPPLNWGIYLVLVAAAVIGTFSSQTLRLLGVRHR